MAECDRGPAAWPGLPSILEHYPRGGPGSVGFEARLEALWPFFFPFLFPEPYESEGLGPRLVVCPVPNSMPGRCSVFVVGDQLESPK